MLGTAGAVSAGGSDGTDADDEPGDSGGCSLRPARTRGASSGLVAVLLMLAIRRRAKSHTPSS
jgi:hypothetical protein